MGLPEEDSELEGICYPFVCLLCHYESQNKNTHFTPVLLRTVVIETHLIFQTGVGEEPSHGCSFKDSTKDHKHCTLPLYRSEVVVRLIDRKPVLCDCRKKTGRGKYYKSPKDIRCQ